MRILMQHDLGGGNEPPRFGLTHVFKAAGFEVVNWNCRQISAHDAFNTVGEVDIFIGQTYNLDRAITKCLALRPNTRVLLQCSTYGKILEEMDLTKYPILTPTQAELRTVENLVKFVDKPILVYQNYHHSFVESCLGLWYNVGVTPISGMHAADYYLYHGGNFDARYSADVSYIGGLWPYKGQNIYKYIFPLLNKYSAPKVNGNKVSVKLFGNGGWNGVPQYMGCPQDNKLKDIFASATINLNVHEPHSNIYGFDCVERIWKIACSGGFCISDYVLSLERDVFTQEEVPFYRNYAELCDLIIYYLKNPDKRAEKITAAYNTTLKHHLYHNRAWAFLTKLGFTKEAEKVATLHNEILEQAGLPTMERS